MTMNSLSSFQLQYPRGIAQHRSFKLTRDAPWCSMLLKEELFPRLCRLQSVTYAIRIVLFAHFYNTVRNVMSMVEVLSLWRGRIQRVVEIGRLRRRCLTAVHALLELIDTQIIVAILMLLMIMMLMVVSSIVGLCSPAFWYSWSFCVRSVRRIVIGKMWQADWLIVMSHITRRRGRSWWTRRRR